MKNTKWSKNMDIIANRRWITLRKKLINLMVIFQLILPSYYCWKNKQIKRLLNENYLRKILIRMKIHTKRWICAIHALVLCNEFAMKISHINWIKLFANMRRKRSTNQNKYESIKYKQTIFHNKIFHNNNFTKILLEINKFTALTFSRIRFT